VIEATQLMQDLVQRGQPPTPGQRNDWPDLLAADLARDATSERAVVSTQSDSPGPGRMPLSHWADANGLARETLSRGFVAAYGTTPSVFRAELRARAAWLRITRGRDRLSAIASETGFADQAHMTRWIRRLTGASPAAWRQPQLQINRPDQRDQRDQIEKRGSPSTIVPVSTGFSPVRHIGAR